MKHKIGGACIVLRTVPNIYPLNKSQLSLLAFKFLDKYWQVSLHKCYQSVLPSVWEWPPLYILNTVNYFLIFANMSMTYHNSLICISLIKHEVKDTSICLSAFLFPVSWMFHRLLSLAIFLLICSCLCIREFGLCTTSYSFIVHSTLYFIEYIPILNDVFIYDYFIKAP